MQNMLSFSVPSRGPNGVRVTSIEFSSDLLVEWDPLAQHYANGKLLGYIVYYIEESQLHKSVNTSHYPTQLTLKGLKTAHVYHIAVAAITSKGVGPLSDFAYATTGTFLNYYFSLFFGGVKQLSPVAVCLPEDVLIKRNIFILAAI